MNFKKNKKDKKDKKDKEPKDERKSKIFQTLRLGFSKIKSSDDNKSNSSSTEENRSHSRTSAQKNLSVESTKPSTNSLLDQLEFQTFFQNYLKQVPEKILDFFLLHQVNKSAHKDVCILETKPIYLVFSSTKALLFDASVQSNPTTIFSFEEIKEITVDSKYENILCIGLASTERESFYFLCQGKEMRNEMLRQIEECRSAIAESNPSLPPIVINKRFLFQDESTSLQTGFDASSLTPVLEQISLGYSEKEIWSGSVDLIALISNNRILAKLKEENDLNDSIPIEFLLPDRPEFSGNSRRVFKINKRQSPKQLINSLCAKVGVDSSQFSLCTLTGRQLEPNYLLEDYGVGFLFLSWQLKVVERANPNTGQIATKIQFPSSDLFSGIKKTIFKVDAYQTVKQVIESICLEAKLEKPNQFQLLFEGKSLKFTDTLSQHGFKENTNLPELQFDFFQAPKSSGDKKRDEIIVKSILQDILEVSVLKGQERKWKSIYSYCNFLIETIIRDAVTEIEKAEAFVPSISTLEKDSKQEVYRMLFRYEMEDDATTHIHNISKFLREKTKKVIASYEGSDKAEESDLPKETQVPAPPGFTPPPPPIFDPKKKSISSRFPVSSVNKEKSVAAKGTIPLVSQADIMNMRSALKSRVSPPQKTNPSKDSSSKFPKVALHPPKPKS